MAQSLLDKPILIIKDKSFIKIAIETIKSLIIKGLILVLIVITFEYFIFTIFSIADAGNTLAYVILFSIILVMLIILEHVLNKSKLLNLNPLSTKQKMIVLKILSICNKFKVKKYLRLSKKEKIIFIVLIIVVSLISLSRLYTFYSIQRSVENNNQNGYFINLSNTIINNNTEDLTKINNILTWQKNNLLFTLDKSLPILYTNTYFVVNWPLLLRDYPKPPYINYFTNLPNMIIWSNINDLSPSSKNNLSLFNNGNPKKALITIYSRDCNPNASYEEISKWTLISKTGNCMEHSLAFTQLANDSGISVKTIFAKGEDHVFNAVYINNTWITVDPTQDYPYNPSLSMEEYLKVNLSYVYAIYPNGTIEDVTKNYTIISNLTILVINENKEPIENVTVKLFSNNKKPKLDANLSLKTDINGICTFYIGEGNYNFEAYSNNLTGKLSNIDLVNGENKNEEIILNTKFTESNDNINDNIYVSVLVNTIILSLIITLLSYFLLILIKMYNEKYKKAHYALLIITIAFLLIICIAIEPLMVLIIIIIACALGYIKYMRTILKCSF